MEREVLPLVISGLLLFPTLSLSNPDTYTLTIKPKEDNTTKTFDSLDDKEFNKMLKDMKESKRKDLESLKEECKAAREFNTTDYFGSVIKNMMLINCSVNGF